jgi:pectate lyase
LIRKIAPDESENRIRFAGAGQPYTSTPPVKNTCHRTATLLAAGLLAASSASRAESSATATKPPQALFTSLEPEFFVKLAKNDAFKSELAQHLADSGFRSFGHMRSIRVQLWTETTTETPAIILEYQTAWDKFNELPNRGPVQFDPVQTGVGRDNMLFRTFFGGTDDPAARQELKDLWERRAKTPSNRRAALDPELIALAKKYLPGTPLPQVREDVVARITELVEAHKTEGAQIIPDPVYGQFGAKINEHLYLYIRDFAPEAETRFPHDPFFWLIVSGGPKPMPSGYLPAFPGAEGPGALATGGRGGKVIYVTTLNSSGPGSFLEALQTKGPRIILFNVSGQIDLPDPNFGTGAPPSWIAEPDATIIGYTAPGEGVEIHGRLNMKAGNIIIRGMRYRLRPPLKDDGMNTEGNLENIIFDHNSFGYGSDEALRFIGNNSTFHGFTIQYCVLGPGLAGLSAHPYGPEVGGYGAFHHNLFYNTLSRSPEVDCELIDWSYNIMANLRGGHSLRPQSRFKFTNNYIVDMPGALEDYSFNANESVWADGNLRRKGADTAPFEVMKEGPTRYLRAPFPTLPLTHHKAGELMDVLLPAVGASLPVRDKTDQFFIAMLKQDQSKLPVFKPSMATWKPYGNQNNRMEQYIPWDDADSPPVSADATPILDTDGDGMPDAWETAHGLNPKDATDGPADPDKDGYTNVEEFLYRTDPHVFVDYTKAENNRDQVFGAATQ